MFSTMRMLKNFYQRAAKALQALNQKGAGHRCLIFFRSESGMTLPVLAFAMIAMTSLVGLAIDAGRVQMVQSKLQFSLDAAGLAAGSTVSTSDINAETAKYLNANFNGYMGSTLLGSSVVPNSANTVFTISATVSVPTTFMSVTGVQTVTLSATSQITRAITGLELVLVLDNTGSMANSAGGGVSKISALKTAASTLINTLFGGNTTSTDGKLWVGVVPFSQAVNIGTSHPTWIDPNYTYDGTSTPLDWGPSNSWGGCVDARQNGEDITDDPPSQGTPSTLFGQYYWTSDNLNTDGISNGGKNQWKFPTYNECQENYRRCDSAGQNCVSKYGSCSTGGGHQCTDLNAQTCSTVSNCTGSYNSCTVNGYTYSSPLNATSSGPSYECPLEINPLTNNSTTLLSTINAMQPLGNTVINQGLQWGWNMLSPRWQGLWGGTMNANGLPLAYNTQGMVKALVLLTDGENTIGDSDHSSYWFLDSGRTGSTNGTTAVNDLNTKTQQLCNAMKAQGIYVYTIALGTDTTSTSLALLQNCATAVNYYWNSPSTTQLQGIFGQIGDSLANLRVSQ